MRTIGGVTPPRSAGYFEQIAGDRVRGWASDSNGDPAPVMVHVNGALAVTIPVPRPALWEAPGEAQVRCRFDAPVQVRHGDRIELFNGVTREPLAGGVRTVVDALRRPRVGLAAPVREEAPYLLEWIAYHRALGIESILLADNGGADRTSELLEALHEVGLIHRVVEPSDDPAFQTRFDLDAAGRLRGLVDVVSLTDVDEFLRPLNGRSDIPSCAAEIFARHDVSAVALSLVVYGSSGRDEPGDGLVVERFTRRAPDDHVFHRTIKSMVRPERLAAMLNPHQVVVTCGDYVNDRGDALQWAEAPAVTLSASWNSLRADHFVVKSYREYLQKAARGHRDGAIRDEAFFRSRDRNDVTDPIPEEFVARTKAELVLVHDRLRRYSPRWAELRHALQ